MLAEQKKLEGRQQQLYFVLYIKVIWELLYEF